MREQDVIRVAIHQDEEPADPGYRDIIAKRDYMRMEPPLQVICEPCSAPPLTFYAKAGPPPSAVLITTIQLTGLQFRCMASREPILTWGEKVRLCRGYREQWYTWGTMRGTCEKCGYVYDDIVERFKHKKAIAVPGFRAPGTWEDLEDPDVMLRASMLQWLRRIKRLREHTAVFTFDIVRAATDDEVQQHMRGR